MYTTTLLKSIKQIKAVETARWLKVVNWRPKAVSTIFSMSLKYISLIFAG